MLGSECAVSNSEKIEPRSAAEGVVTEGIGTRFTGRWFTGRWFGGRCSTATKRVSPKRIRVSRCRARCSCRTRSRLAGGFLGRLFRSGSVNYRPVVLNFVEALKDASTGADNDSVRQCVQVLHIQRFCWQGGQLAAGCTIHNDHATDATKAIQSCPADREDP